MIVIRDQSLPKSLAQSRHLKGPEAGVCLIEVSLYLAEDYLVLRAPYIFDAVSLSFR